MKTEEIQAKQQSDLHKKLWAAADDLRGSMEGNEYKDYLLGLIFYRYLSEKIVLFVDNELKEDNLTYEQVWENEEDRNDLKDRLLSENGTGYIIEPQYLWSAMIAKF